MIPERHHTLQSTCVRPLIVSWYSGPSGYRAWMIYYGVQALFHRLSRTLSNALISRQVVVSGPNGFVFRVENLLDEMKVPKRAIVMLD